MAQQGQSYGTTAGTSNLGASAMESTDFVLPLKSRQRSFRLGIGLVLVGMTTTIFGAACYADHIFNVLSFSGINIWGGMLYGLAGSLALASHYNPLNYYITHAYYYNSIISTLAALVQFVLSAVAFRRKKYIWFEVLSLLLSLPAFALSLCCFLILYTNIYRYRRHFSHTGDNYSNFSNEDHGVPPPAQSVPSAAYISTSTEA